MLILHNRWRINNVKNVLKSLIGFIQVKPFEVQGGKNVYIGQKCAVKGGKNIILEDSLVLRHYTQIWSGEGRLELVKVPN